MVMEMEVVIKIDKQGRIVLPKDIREKYHFQSDSDIILIDKQDGLLLKPKPAKKTMKDLIDKASKKKLQPNMILDIANYHEEDLL